MSKAFKKEDSDSENVDLLREAYERQRVAQLGGGSYAKGMEYLENLTRRTGRSPIDPEDVLPPVIHEHTARLRIARRYTNRSKKLAALIRAATGRQDELERLLLSTEPVTDESIAKGGKAYGELTQTIRDIEIELGRLEDSERRRRATTSRRQS